MVVVHDGDYPTAIQKLKTAGFTPTLPNRAPAREILDDHPDPWLVVAEINAGYRRVDRHCAVFDYPEELEEGEEKFQVYLFPNSFAHVPVGCTTAASTTRWFDVYGNVHYPLERALVESFVKAAIDEEDQIVIEDEDQDGVGYSVWADSLGSWISQMMGYLEVDNDVLDGCPDGRAVEWYSTRFGRIREVRSGPLDRRVSKRLGSGKVMAVDMRGGSV